MLDVPQLISREEGRRLFGLNPQSYEDARPAYPAWIFEQLRDSGALAPGTATLEIGPGTGMATRELLAYGADPLTLIETDRRFAALLESARRSSASCRVIHQAFEEAALPTNGFDLIVAATAFHWIEQSTGLQKIRRILRDDGFAALFWNVLQDPDKEDAFHEATQGLLAPLAVSPSGAPDTVPYALDRRAREADARASGSESVAYHESRWTLVLNSEQIEKLYEGFSHVQRLDADSRSSLLSKLRAIGSSIQR